MICRHCKQECRRLRARGLCCDCFYQPEIRQQYPLLATLAERGGAMPEPTDALPGTPEKVAVLEERARRRQALFHPLDARYSQDVDIPLPPVARPA
jgi:hypothetical protein